VGGGRFSSWPLLALLVVAIVMAGVVLVVVRRIIVRSGRGSSEVRVWGRNEVKKVFLAQCGSEFHRNTYYTRAGTGGGRVWLWLMS
jgi:hypothetical protein